MVNKLLNQLQKKYGRIFSAGKSFAKNETVVTLNADAISHLPVVCADIISLADARFITLIAADERPAEKSFSLSYVFSISRGDLFFILRVPVDLRQREVPTISTVVEAANWFEREAKDWFGIVSFPNIQRLAVHPDWPEDIYEMVTDFKSDRSVPRVKGSFDFKHVEGEGVFEIPVGPIHAGIIEPGHFRFSVAGEPIINLDTQLYYAHKGTEKIAEGMDPRRTVFVAERISGDSSFAHAAAFCHAIERASGIEVPQRAQVVRTMLLELERMTNHIGDIGGILLDVGFSIGAVTASRLKERFMRTNEILTGSRLLRAVASIGGVRRDIEDTSSKRDALREIIHEGKDAFEYLVDVAMSSSTVRDRLETTGVLSNENARRLGIVGIAGRASGMANDFRKEHPHCAYRHLDFKTALHTDGDVLARLNVRIDEVRQSFRILQQTYRGQTRGSLQARVGRIPGGRHALGYTEGWRGEIVHWVAIGEDGTITRWRITDPSQHNWRGLLVAVRNNIVPDFPVINKSFNLSYSGNDR